VDDTLWSNMDDLEDFYLRTGEKGSILGGKFFNAANNRTESIDDILQKLVEVNGTGMSPLFEEMA
jgi:hypothetical protein